MISEQLLEDAQQLIIDNKASAAIELCRDIIDRDPDNGEGWHLLGSACHLDGDLDKALDYLGHAVTLQPQNQRLHVNFGLVVSQSGFFEKALDIFDMALDRVPEDLAAHEGLGRTLMEWAEHFGITGWFTCQEAAQLYRLIRSIKDEAPVIIELGSCFGLSSMIVARALQERLNSKVYCIDAWEDGGSTIDGKTREFVKNLWKADLSFFELFQKGMSAAGVLKDLTPIKGYTGDIARTWEQPADAIFIDANHSYEGVRGDVESWKNFVKPGGLIILHDVELVCAGAKTDSGPGRVVLEQLGKSSGFKPLKLVDSLYAAFREN